MAYYDLLVNMWVMNNLSQTQIQNAVTKGYITQAQADAIIATPKAV